MCKYHLALVTLLSFCCILVGCNGTDAANAGAAARGTFVILIDRSASINKTNSSAYMEFLRQFVLPSITPGSHFLAEPIAGDDTRNPDPEHVVDITLPALTPFHKGLNYYLFHGDTSEDKTCDVQVGKDLHVFEGARDHLAAAVQQHVFSPTVVSQRTFLLDAVRVASDYLNERPGRRVLVILSDGLEDSDEFGSNTNFANPNFWVRHKSGQLIAQLHPRRNFVGLRGADVYFFGIGGNHQVHDTVADFWRAFFSAADVKQAGLSQPPLYKENLYLASSDEEHVRNQLSEICK